MPLIMGHRQWLPKPRPVIALAKWVSFPFVKKRSFLFWFYECKFFIQLETVAVLQVFGFYFGVIGRIGEVKRVTKETNVFVKINLDGTGVAENSTGIPFLDHMLDVSLFCCVFAPHLLFFFGWGAALYLIFLAQC